MQACEIQLKSEVNYNEAVWCSHGGEITVGVVYIDVHQIVSSSE